MHLFFSVCFSQFKNMYDTSKEASNQYLCIRMCGSSIKLSFLSNTDKQSTVATVLETSYNRDKIEQKQLFWRVLTIFNTSYLVNSRRVSIARDIN